MPSKCLLLGIIYYQIREYLNSVKKYQYLAV